MWKLGDTRTWRRMGLECEMCLSLRFRTRFEEKQGFCRYRKLIIFGTALWVHEREICSRDFAEECLAFKLVLLEVFFRTWPSPRTVRCRC